MGRAGLLIILLLFFASTAKSQSELTYKQVDSIMYANFTTENWDEVISTGKDALQNNIDYFYLRMRMGIACYNTGNYRSAAGHLVKAGDFNPGYWLVKDYLYHSYLYSGQHDEAALIAGGMNDGLREMSGINKPKAFSTFYLETGPEFSDNLDKHEMDHLPGGQDLREQDLYGNSFYTHLGAKLQIHPNISMYAGFSNLRISKQAGLQYYAGYSPDSIVQYEWGFAKFFPSRPKVETSSYDYTLKQNGVYVNANILLGRGWSFTPAMNYVHVNTKSIDIDNNSSFVRDTAYYNQAIDSMSFLYYNQIRFDIRPTTLILNNFVVSLAFNKQISVFDLGIFGSWSNLNDLHQIQFGASVTYYPFGNLNFYGNTTIKGLSEEKKPRAVFSQMLGGKVARFLWMEGFVSYGNLRGTNESNAFIVYNISDEINLKTGVNLTFVISPAVQLSIRYQYLQKQGYRTVSGPGMPQGMRIEELDYTNQSIIGGLKWTL